MWYWPRKGTGGRASVLAQRAASEGPRSGASASWHAEGWAGEILRAVEAHPPVPFSVMGGEGRGKARNFFVNTIVLSAVALTLLSGCALFTPREEVQLKKATAEELTALLSQQKAAIRTMKGLFSAKVRGGIIPIASRVEGALYYRRPNAMRLRAAGEPGGEY